MSQDQDFLWEIVYLAVIDWLNINDKSAPPAGWVVLGYQSFLIHASSSVGYVYPICDIRPVNTHIKENITEWNIEVRYEN